MMKTWESGNSDSKGPTHKSNKRSPEKTVIKEASINPFRVEQDKALQEENLWGKKKKEIAGLCTVIESLVILYMCISFLGLL